MSAYTSRSVTERTDLIRRTPHGAVYEPESGVNDPWRCHQCAWLNYNGDLYERHCANCGEDGALGAGLVVTPSQMRAEIDSIDAAVVQLNLEVTRDFLNSTDTTKRQWASAWRAWRAEWNAFKPQASKWTAQMWGGTMDKIEEYRNRLNQWRAQFVQMGGATAGPGLGPADAPFLEQMKPWLIGFGVLIGLALVYKLLRALRGASRVIAPAPAIAGAESEIPAPAPTKALGECTCPPTLSAPPRQRRRPQRHCAVWRRA